VKTRVVVAAGRSALRATLVAGLNAAGFRVAAECASAQAVVEAVARERPDVCVLDAELPGGALVAAAAIASPPSPPAVIVVDPNGTTAAERAAELAGASEYLPGDPDEDRLADAVNALAEQRRRP
jgi:DNA-binding NarL/FixJ family response regulator